MLIGGLDQGTTSSRFLLFDEKGRIAAQHQLEHNQIHAHPGWCEHDPFEIVEKVVTCINEAVKQGNVKGDQVAAIGITNQRETTVAWDRVTGRPLCNAIVWHDLRTAETAQKLIETFGVNGFRAKTGLPISTYFSAVKMKWMIENVPEVQQAIAAETCVFGTVDSWLIYNLTGGASGGLILTDVTNASRTLLMNLNTLEWDPELCAAFGVPIKCLPAIRSSAEVYGTLKTTQLQGVRIASAMGDQQAATLGNGCIREGQCKSTYGTGCFLMTNTGTTAVPSSHGLLTTVGYKLGPNTPTVYALEGAIPCVGSAIGWLKDNLGVIDTVADIDRLAGSVETSGGVTIIPAFSGLLAPHWRSDARAAMIGLTLHTSKAHICRAMLEGIAFQVCDVMTSMNKDLMAVSNSRTAATTFIHHMSVDGGVTNSKQLLAVQANLLGFPISRWQIPEITTFGAAFAAGLAVGYWTDINQITEILESQGSETYAAYYTEEQRNLELARWREKVPFSFASK